MKMIKEIVKKDNQGLFDKKVLNFLKKEILIPFKKKRKIKKKKRGGREREHIAEIVAIFYNRTKDKKKFIDFLVEYFSFTGDEFKNVVMVGDPKQSIYGFNTADPKLMNQFRMDFNAEYIELNENFRSSKQVVNAAKALDENYVAEGLLPINGEVGLITGEDEDDEARNVIKKIQELLKNGHPDVEGEITLERCAVLARTRYVLLTLEEELAIQRIPHYKQISPTYEIESLLLKV